MLGIIKYRLYYLNNRLYKHPSPGEIFLPTRDKYKGRERKRAIGQVINLFENKLDSIYKPLLVNLAHRYRNRERCFIVGNGPSINRTDLSKLKGEVTFGVNSIFLKYDESDFRPTFYVVEDHLVAEDRAREINALKGSIKLIPVYLSYCIEEKPDTVFFNHVPRKSYPQGFDFSKNAAEVTYAGGTVTFTCMQLAYYLGFKTIYLVGVDHSYSMPKTLERNNNYNIDILDMEEDDPNHFSPEYFGRGYRWHDPKPEKMEEAYREAKKITDASGVRIINATKGGALELFERADYDSLFPAALINDNTIPHEDIERIINVPVCSCAGQISRNEPAMQNLPSSERPKVLIVSSTLMKNDSATGSLVRKLFTGWNRDRLIQIHDASGEPDTQFCSSNIRIREYIPDLDRLIDEIRLLEPEVIYFRTTEQPIVFFEFVNRLIEKTHLPLITHFMDDWPERCRIMRPARYCDIRPYICRLVRYAHTNLTISEQMSDAYRERYGRIFYAISNFIDFHDIPANNLKVSSDKKDFLIRYSGSLADDMQLDSIIDIARTVSKLSDTLPVKLEISVHDRFKKNASRLKEFKNVSLKEFSGFDDYLRSLSACDLLIIATNFDSDSISYIRYSLANKIPEYMNSGTPILVYGSPETATVRYADGYGWAKVVKTRSDNALGEAIRELYDDPNLRNKLVANALKVVRERHNAESVRSGMQDIVMQAVIDCDSDKRNGTLGGEIMFGGLSRDEKVTVNETSIIAELLGSKQGGVLVNVGAHTGSSLQRFIKNNWDIYAFEPDPRNRELLSRNYKSYPKIRIDGRAISDHKQQQVPFFTSEVSSGIGSLMDFHTSHVSDNYVEVTTLSDICDEYSIDNIDLLLIDAEGFDLPVLKGLDWGKYHPSIVICEFEDNKTQLLGYQFHDIAGYLLSKNYQVFVSVWHPVIRYGMPHDWYGLMKYPCTLPSGDVWGNLLAFSEKEYDGKIENAFRCNAHKQVKRNAFNRIKKLILN